MNAPPMKAAPLIVLAAGGTGGHVFPAQALAEALLERGLRLALITDRRGAGYGGVLGRIETCRIAAGGIAGRKLWGRARGVLELCIGFFQARALLRRLAPSVVVGFGGYASIPTMLAAVQARRPTLIHEQNAVLGRANRLLAPRVSRIATSFESTAALPEGCAATHTGMPVRPAVIEARATPYPAIEADKPLGLLVLGGSQGARVFSDVLPDAVARLPEDLRRRLSITQQCRTEDLDRVRSAYAASGIKAELAPFFADVPARLAASHLVVSRAGASTVAEVMVCGRPAVLVPYPHAVDDHQTANAHAVDEVGGGWLIPQDAFTPDTLAQRLTDLLGMPATLAKTAACARASGRPDAAERLAELVGGLIPQDDEAPRHGEVG